MVLDQDKISEIIAKMRSASIEERLEALKKSIEIRESLFKNCTTIEEWVKASLIVEQLYAFTCELLNTRPIRIGDLEETDNIQVGENASSLPRKKKADSPTKPKLRVGRPTTDKKAEKAAQFQVLFAEFAKRVGEQK